MSRGINKWHGVGNLGADPEVKYSDSGTAITRISIGYSESWKDKGGQKQERTEWVRIVFFGRLAEIAGEYLKRGRQVYVEGKLRTNKWQDKDGNDRYTTEILANEMQMLGQNSAIGSGQQPQKPQNNGSVVPNQSSPATGFDDFDDEIPF